MVGGAYIARSRRIQAFVAHQVVVSCAWCGNCSAGGDSGPTFNGPAQPWSSTKSRNWRKAILDGGALVASIGQEAMVTDEH